MCDLKEVIFKKVVKRLTKLQFSIYNRKLVFKIMRF
jgi:hypothetical protein